jgi:hypothetical protein
MPSTSKTSKYILRALVGIAILYTYFVYTDMNYSSYQYTFDAINPPENRMHRLTFLTELFNGPYYRWRFKISPDEFSSLQESLKSSDWPEWTNTGGSYGAFNQDASYEDPLLNTRKPYPHGRGTIMYYYRPSSGELNAIRYRH